MSNQSDRPSTPDYQCDTDNIESRPIASSSNTLSQADRPGFVMSSQTDSGVESKLVVIDTGNITDKDSESIRPSKIVLAGDSAGGNLCSTALTVLRDMGMPLPARAILISPWVDLTHNFPSNMHNSKTDIIPLHGFLARPSTLWPIDPVPPLGGRACATESNPPPKPGHADTRHLNPSAYRGCKYRYNRDRATPRGNAPTPKHASRSESRASGKSKALNTYMGDCDIDLWEPKPPKVLMKRIELDIYTPAISLHFLGS
ncbi:hypothetical protein F5876DRAFT_76896 [Lentinula aff. lateritia]|uniref:Uncharacterized protein n=1 Tax=Lentinula aff. lateritia TaxID=2804960 RepID=A0ACC1U0H1_9AGAR|nr:hypothetical protein F5876DRAFT_76896 [Lentinula aff. lateritia]